MNIRCMFGKHDWNGCTCSLCNLRRDQDHIWDGCQCTRCFKTRHEYITIEEEILEGSGCCWSSDEPCTGPNCGTPCDNYYPERKGKRRITKQCKFCGRKEIMEEQLD